jgi:hypothetical protein
MAVNDKSANTMRSSEQESGRGDVARKESVANRG